MTETTVYVAGGTVQAGGGIYLKRAADDQLLALCRNGAFAFVLTSRQMGKSSLMVRTAERLSEEDVRSVIIDLTELGVDVTADQWYKGFVLNLEDQLGLRTKAAQWWEDHQELGIPQRFNLFLRRVVLGEVTQRVTIFVDEIDTTLRLKFTDDFFTAIRYLYNARADTADLARLSFVLIGVAMPGDLIKDPDRTPFNIGHRVELADFTLEEARQLLVGISLPAAEADQVLRWVLGWTGGHPYLTLRLFRSLAENPPESWSEQVITQRVAELYFGRMREQDSNLQFVRDMLTKKAFDPDAVLETYRDIRRGRKVRDEDLSLVKSWLKLSGVVYPDSGMLRVRNKIYETVFTVAWVREHLRINWPRLFVRVSRVLVVLVLTVALPVAWYAEQQKARAVASLGEAIKQQRIAQHQTIVAAQSEARAAAEAALARAAEASASAQAKLAMVAADKARTQEHLATKLRREADVQRRRAEALKEISLARGLAAQSSYLRNTRADRYGVSSLLAVEALRRSQKQKLPLPAAEQLVRESLSLLPELIGQRTLDDGVSLTTLSPDGSRTLVLRKGQASLVDNQTGRELVRFPPSFAAALPRLNFSQDGRRLFGLLETKPVLWDVEAGREMILSDARMSPGKNQAISRSQSPSKGSAVLAPSLRSEGDKLILSDPSLLQVWNLDDGTPAIKPVELKMGSSSRVLAIDAGAHRIAMLGPTGKMSVWSSETEKLSTFDRAEGVVAAAFTPDGHRLAVANSEAIVLWNQDDGEQVWDLPNREAPISSLTFSPDAKWVLALSQDGTVRVCDAEDGDEVATLSHEWHVDAMIFSHDADRLVTITSGKVARVWQAGSWTEIARLGYDKNLGFSPDGERLVTIRDRTMEVWKVGKGEPGIHLIKGDDVRALSFFSRDGSRLAIARGEGEKTVVDAVDALSGKIIATLPQVEGVDFLVMSADGRRVLTDHEDHQRVWDIESKKELATHAGSEVVPPTLSATLSANGQLIASVPTDGAVVKIRELPGGKVRAELRVDPLDPIFAKFSPDGRLLAIWGLGPVQVWDIAKNERVNEVKDAGDILWAEFSPDSRLLAIREGATVRLWDFGPAGSKLTLSHDEDVKDLAFSRDGHWLVTGSSDKTARVWDVATGKEMARIAGSRAVVRVAFTADNRIELIDDTGFLSTEPWHMNDVMSALCRRIHRNLDRKEWAQYLTGEPYVENTCPGQTVPNLP